MFSRSWACLPYFLATPWSAPSLLSLPFYLYQRPEERPSQSSAQFMNDIPAPYNDIIGNRSFHFFTMLYMQKMKMMTKDIWRKFAEKSVWQKGHCCHPRLRSLAKCQRLHYWSTLTASIHPSIELLLLQCVLIAEDQGGRGRPTVPKVFKVDLNWNLCGQTWPDHQSIFTLNNVNLLV